MSIVSPRSSAKGYTPPPTEAVDIEDLVRKVSLALGLAMTGKLNVTKYPVTLTAGATQTTISDTRIGSTTALLLVPTTANAKAAMTDIHQTYPNATEQAAVLNHSSSGQTDRTFVAVLLG